MAEGSNYDFLFKVCCPSVASLGTAMASTRYLVWTNGGSSSLYAVLIPLNQVVLIGDSGVGKSNCKLAAPNIPLNEVFQVSFIAYEPPAPDSALSFHARRIQPRVQIHHRCRIRDEVDQCGWKDGQGADLGYW